MALPQVWGSSQEACIRTFWRSSSHQPGTRATWGPGKGNSPAQGEEVVIVTGDPLQGSAWLSEGRHLKFEEGREKALDKHRTWIRLLGSFLGSCPQEQEYCPHIFCLPSCFHRWTSVLHLKSTPPLVNEIHTLVSGQRHCTGNAFLSFLQHHSFSLFWIIPSGVKTSIIFLIFKKTNFLDSTSLASCLPICVVFFEQNSLKASPIVSALSSFPLTLFAPQHFIINWNIHIHSVVERSLWWTPVYPIPRIYHQYSAVLVLSHS